MEQLQLREKEIFETLKKIKKSNFVVIGGYAVNAYTLPRFSADCDIVIKNRKELEEIEEALLELGYVKNQVLEHARESKLQDSRHRKEKNYSDEVPYEGNFERFEKELEYIAQRYKGKVLTLADLNFGMYNRDVEISKAIARIKDRYGYPYYIQVSTGKHEQEWKKRKETQFKNHRRL